MTTQDRTGAVMMAIGALFALLLVAFSLDLFGRPVTVKSIEPVDPAFLDTATWRKSYADLVKEKGELDMFDCYTCHEEGKRVTLTFDEQKRLVIPEEHEDIVMGHGPHGRNNNCFNCHNDENLLRLQARDGRDLKFEESSQLCGSCHGPTKDDWDAGAHGRISGQWDPKSPERTRRDCVNCHNPHSPKFPGRKPAPPPVHLREVVERGNEKPSDPH